MITPATSAVRLCIVGAGPRGLSVLERLCAALRPGSTTAQRGRSTTAVVHLVDPHVDVGGAVWRTDQPAELLMNTVASQVTLFADDSVGCTAPIVPGPSLYEWARDVERLDSAGRVPAAVRRECRGLGPDTYPTRACYGYYLRWVLDELLRTLPPGLTVTRHRATATAVREADDGTQTVTLSDGTVLRDLGAVVLVQGHVPAAVTAHEGALAAAAARGGLTYLPPGNPAEADLSAIGPGTTVAIRGLGLNFFDHMTLLTRGRGGTFDRTDGGRLRYRPSGAEPHLAVGSRRGVPHHARGENQKGAFGRHEPLFLTPWAIAGLRRRADAGRPADFGAEVWPLIDREVRSVYYTALVRERSGAAAAGAFLRDYRSVVDVRPLGRLPDPLDIGDTPTERALLERHGITDGARWRWGPVARPWEGRVFTGPGDHRDWLLALLRADVEQALRGNVDSPTKAAVDALRDLRNEIRLVVDHGGVSGTSYRRDVHGWYTSLNAFLSIGPPAARIEELIALVECGVAEVVGPGMRVEVAPAGDAFVVCSPLVPGVQLRAGALIEARMPEPDLDAAGDPLLRDLLAAGGCARYEVRDADGAGYLTRGLAVTRRPYHLVDATGVPHPRRFAFGVPTEGVHWVTAAGIRPGVGSVIVADADAVAGAALAAASGRPVEQVPAAAVPLRVAGF